MIVLLFLLPLLQQEDGCRHFFDNPTALCDSFQAVIQDKMTLNMMLERAT